MTVNTGYPFYKQEYYGEKLTEEQFEKFSVRAELYLESHFLGNLEAEIEADEELAEKVSYCLCELAEAMFDGVKPKVSSVSNDGYTENYVVEDSEVIYSEILTTYLADYTDTGVVRFL